MIVVGFSGTREGMRASQRRTLSEFLAGHTVTCFHHGDCIGADSEAHDQALDLGIPIHRHPPLRDRYRAFREEGTASEPKEYRERNRDIVAACDVLVAAPLDVCKQTGGTWSTIAYAKAKGKRVVILP